MNISLIFKILMYIRFFYVQILLQIIYNYILIEFMQQVYSYLQIELCKKIEYLIIHKIMKI